MSQLRAKPLPQVMSQPVVALQTYDTVAVALSMAKEHAVHHFPVCARASVVGMVCTCDFREVSPETQVGDVMRPAVTIPSGRSSADAALLMKAALVGSILVVDWEGSPCGIVTRGDLAGDSDAEIILQECRCECCGIVDHLRTFGSSILCVSCRERAEEPDQFETGGGD